MDLIGGEELAAVIERGSVEPKLALELIRQVADALEAGHKAGILGHAGAAEFEKLGPCP